MSGEKQPSGSDIREQVFTRGDALTAIERIRALKKHLEKLSVQCGLLNSYRSLNDPPRRPVTGR